MSAPDLEIRTTCRSCQVIVRFPPAIAGEERPCPCCGAPVRVEGARVPVERAEFSADRERAEFEVEPTGASGALFGGGLTAGIAGLALSTMTPGRLSMLLMASGLSMIVAWVLSRRLPPRSPR